VVGIIAVGGRLSLLVGGGVGPLLPLVYGGESSLPFGNGGGGGFSSQFVDGGCGPSWMVVVLLVAIGR